MGVTHRAPFWSNRFSIIVIQMSRVSQKVTVLGLTKEYCIASFPYRRTINLFSKATYNIRYKKTWSMGMIFIFRNNKPFTIRNVPPHFTILNNQKSRTPTNICRSIISNINLCHAVHYIIGL